MSSFDKSLSLAKAVVPAVAMIVFVIVKAGSGFGLMVVPFVAVAVIGIVQAVRRSGFFGGSKLRGKVADSADRGRLRADEILNQRD
jgi:UPF0716 family protein affecting phage T7 exclusion